MAVRWVSGVLAALLVAASCGGSDEQAAVDPTPTMVVSAPPTATPSEPPPATPDPTARPAPTPTPEPPPTRVRMEVTGPEELVFDWTTDQCEPEHIPDIAARAFRDIDGNVQLTIGHYVNYRMIGPELGDVENDCTVVLRSTFDPDPAQFDDSAWLGGLYTDDGQTVYAIVHNEYRGDTHGATNPRQCPDGRRFTCLDTSLTLYVSRDGGDSYAPIATPPGHLVATLPYVFDDEGLPTGLRQPSNIVSGRDGYVYVFSNVSSYPAEEQWVCVMRTDDLEDPTSWRYWDGEAFVGQFIDPYQTDPAGAETCAPLARPQLDVSIQEAVVLDESLGRFVMIGTSHEPFSAERWGIYYSTSENLIEWTARQVVVELPSYSSVGDFDNDEFYSYASLLDPDSSSLSFDTTDGELYLYITRFHAGTSSLDRDLVRFPVRTSLVEVEPPAWPFDTDGELDRWTAVNHLDEVAVTDGSLVMRTTGDDPYAVVPTSFPSTFARLHIRMRITGDGSPDTGQVFFGTDTRPDHVESASLVFEIVPDGEFRDYELDMAAVGAWDETITSLRLDPGSRAGETVEIDRIWFS